ncbi:hypothetical protein Q1695_000034 [Nippostrongylus brasiliensis]|nr:hypothetical protein Q1695_000034 [Nippostrongylus brasiliensis]
MCATVLLLLLAVKGYFGANTEQWQEAEDHANNLTYKDAEAELHAELRGTLQHFRNCRARNEWMCDRNCRLEFDYVTGQCRHPSPEDTCFGTQVMYKYSHDFDLGRFPTELALLSRYPRCWSYLAPLVCLIMYRPCSKHFFMVKNDSGEIKSGTAEFWQLVSVSYCDLVRLHCGRVIATELLFNYLCHEESNGLYAGDDHIPNRFLFSSTCDLASLQLPVAVKKGVCSWPLVSVEDTVHNESSPVIDDCFLPCRSPLVSNSLGWRYRLVRCIACVFLLICFVFKTIFFARSSRVSHLCLPVFYLFQAMISISIYFVLWCLPIFDSFFSLAECTTDGVSRRNAVSHTIFEWCTTQSMLLYASLLSGFIWLFAIYVHKLCSNPNGLRVCSRSIGKPSRSVVLVTVYGFTASFSAVIVNNLRENDGVSGVCISGLLSFWKYCLSMVPFFCLFSLFCLVAVLKKSAVGRFSVIVGEPEDSGRTSDRCTVCSHCVAPSTGWTVMSFFSAVMFLVLAPAVHYKYASFPFDDYEARSVVTFVKCGTTYGVRNRSFEWPSEDDWPSPRLSEASWCFMPVSKGKEHVEGVFGVFILLPSLPFLMLFVASLTKLYKSQRETEPRELLLDVPLSEKDQHHARSDQKLSIPGAPKNEIGSRPVEARSGLHNDEVFSPRWTWKKESLSNTLEERDICTENLSLAIEEHKGSTVQWQCFLNAVDQLREDLAIQHSLLANENTERNVWLHKLAKLVPFLSQLDVQLCERLPPGLVTSIDSIKPADASVPYPGRSHQEQRSFSHSEGDEETSSNNQCVRSRCERSHVNTTCQKRSEEERVPTQQFTNNEGCSSCVSVVETEAGYSKMEARPSDGGLEVHSLRCHEHPDCESVSDVAGSAMAQQREVISRTNRIERVMRISADAISYSATPRGFMSRLSVPELRIRVEQIRNICASDVLYPQELTYMLLITGDIMYGSSSSQQGLFHYTVEDVPQIFGRSDLTIDARVGVQTFLAHMRRRALTVVAAVGYHFSLRRTRSIEYTPPVLPPLGLYRSENELVLRRVLGDGDDILPSFRAFLQEYNFGRGPVNVRLDLKFVSSFKKYLCLVARREGFHSQDFEEFVPDPVTLMEHGEEKHDDGAQNENEDSIDPPAPL